jgi:ABC-type lipoprotein export system ATPase subunit
VVTHDPFTASYAEKVIRMRDGLIEPADEEPTAN